METKNYKPFDLKKAKAGNPVITREGRAARIVCFDRKDDTYPIIALVNEEEKEDYYSYTKDGRLCADKDRSVDLFMAPVKKKIWINLYEPVIEGSCGYAYATKEEADYNAAPNRIGCKEVEIEM